MQRAKRIIKDELIYILEFLFFTYVIFKVPPVADRWMEGIASYELESPWRYLFGQWRWIETANSRIFSNIFSMIVDRDLMIRALINALMVTFITWIITKICTRNIENFYVKYLVAFCTVLVSWGIQREVYFYAATLYISGILILVLVIYFMQKAWLQTISQHEKSLVYILIFLGSTWVENVSLALLGSVSAYFIVNWILTKKINKTYGIGVVISTIGFALMYINSIFASSGRLSKAKSIKLPFDNISELIYDNILLFAILSATAVMLCFKMIKQLHSKQKIFLQVQIIYWLTMLGICFLMGIRHVYDIISVDPEEIDYVKLVFGWKNFDNVLIDSFFDGSAYRLIWGLLPVMILVGIILILYLLYHNNIFLEGCVLLSMGAMGSAIDLLGLQKGARISLPAIYALIGLIALIFTKSMTDISSKKKRPYKYFLFLIGIVALINMDSMLTFVHIQDEIADERWKIADLVREKQLLGDWDYDVWVVMPKYDINEEGRILAGGKHLNPLNNVDYYGILLRYYHLASDTKIIFSDDDTQLINILNDQNKTAKLFVNNEKKWNDAKYKFVLYNKSLEDILEESEWTSNTYYEVYNLDNLYNGVAKCYISIEEDVVKELDESIIWKE